MCEKSIEAKLECLREAIDFISEQAERTHCSQEDLWQIQLAAEEAIMNIIEHGYKNGSGSIQIACKNDIDIESNTSYFTLLLSDSAYAFDPTQIQEEACYSPYSNKVRGHGIRLIKNIMDEIQYANIENKNVLTLKKTISHALHH